MQYQATPHLSPLATMIREEIERNGPMRFHRFMELALYHPQYGYYVCGAKPVGRSGDFYTASQCQPLYAMLIRRYAERLCGENGITIPQVLTDYGAGKEEMATGFADWQYRPVEVDSPPFDGPLTGLVFANELFDAIPVNVGICRQGRVHEKLVALAADRFVWVESETPSADLESYASRYGVPGPEAFEFESHDQGLELLRGLVRKARNALFIIVDYGYAGREWKRFPAGSLMSYAKHRAVADVLALPGEQDITSHVPFDALMDVAREEGAQILRMERLALALLFAGERDSFQSTLEANSDREKFERRQQLKTLLYGLGESFYVLALRKK